jgi:hypothetical protein
VVVVAKCRTFSETKKRRILPAVDPYVAVLKNSNCGGQRVRSDIFFRQVAVPHKKSAFRSRIFGVVQICGFWSNTGGMNPARGWAYFSEWDSL